MSDLLDKIDSFGARLAELEAQLADPALAKDRKAFAELGKELSRVRPIVEVGESCRSKVAGLADATAMLDDPDADVQELARGEVSELTEEIEGLERKLRLLLVPGDPNDEKNIILELRAGTGGDEAALFAADLFRMYSRYAEKMGWKVETLSLSDTASGGMKEGIFTISGSRVFSRLKHERGVHRVQRVPATESQGRIHTSTATVAVLPEAEEFDLEIETKDLRVDVYRASGPGGQSVNTTDSAVRMTHVPTGLVVQCQDEKSQHKNKAKALKILRSRIYEYEQQKLDDERADARRGQVGSGERSEKIRTYNFPQTRVTDHRAGVTLHRLDVVMQGELDELLDAVHVFMAEEAERQI